MLDLPRHKLIHDVQTRWNTTHDMLERYVEQQAAVYSALLDKNLKTVAKNVAMLSDDEQKLTEELIKLLKPLKTVTSLMSREIIPTTSMILPLKEQLIKSMDHLAEDSPTDADAEKAIAKGLEKRYTDPVLISYLQKSTALDPRFKSLPSLDEASKLQVYGDLCRDILEQDHPETRPPTEEEPAATDLQIMQGQEHPVNRNLQLLQPPPPKKTAMAELLGEVFQYNEQQNKSFSVCRGRGQCIQTGTQHSC